MSARVREVAIKALDNAAGLLDRPEHAREVLAGRDLRLEVLDLDSLTIFEIIMEIEDALGLELDAEQVAGQQSLNDLVELLEAQMLRDGVVVRA